MASRGNNDVYEIMDKFKNNFVFSETLSERLKCFICQKVLVNAKQTSCGCKGCDKCFISLLKDGPQNCPSKQADCKDVVIDMGTLSKDNATNKEIRALKVECPNEGCKKIIEIKELPNHFNECQYRLVKCDKCDKDYQFNLKNVHLIDKCSKRNFKCEWCNKLIVYDDYENDHLNFDSENLCSEYIDNCPNECKVMGKVKIKEHLRNCDEFKVKCPYHSLCCSKKAGMSKTRLVDHLNEKGNEHIEKFIVEFNSLKENVSDYKKEAEHLTNLLNESKEIDKKLSVTIDKIHEENKKLEAQSNSPSLSLATNNRSDGNKVVVFRNGAFIWKIDEYYAKRLDAENGGRISWTSDPFYTSQFGYKMCLRIYPAGDGVGKGSHLSVFFALMKGEYDNLLPWPFKQKVVLSLLDQSGANKHNTDTFKPDARSACYQQPNSDCNIASGSPKFFPLSSLTESIDSFSRDDTLFLKISIDSKDLYKP